MLGPQNSAPMSIEQYQNAAINITAAICAILTRPVELILRPWHGSRYFPPAVVFFSTLLMLFLAAMSSISSRAMHFLPPAGPQLPEGLIGLDSFVKLYFLLSFVHGVRIWRLMIDISREPLMSTFEGPPLPPLMLLPGSLSFWKQRILLEPLVLFVLAVILKRIFIFRSDLALFLQVSAFALAIKGWILWYSGWQFLRDLADSRFEGTILARMFEDRASDDDLGAIHFPGFPKNTPPDMRQAMLINIARAYSPEGEQPPEPEREAPVA
ncbi:MAG TPA: hypothetical protein VME43_08690 [Bryobacteraceae bacterium]|nr:hypothetical protein [Bryobacteraceae bacterium]